ncbi:MAG: sigma-54 dependent transcriptional regulator [Luteibacter sp.]|uniref:sigma-54-dependent transcriptional regulator n=1 Tax=unclassified Luteibacter TaxID=2620188 RepID=UPI0005BD0916|nr:MULTISPECIES: sigma-54 dependent transcriptional regulator [unclassified Luteibacter]MDQ7997080.1 sigma-54 dependent transcriptional regulator [Luteibacter sp.]MDQ8050308.1 sigma-54 dependent transcriptional regulator [Luteibacter sp.]SKB93019.1 DNA-binding transcriptional response regulator, NtrC family, contains REC, AAA-type ATPase, and a Fis-type DNA-binding domains [Luteibacter sp. 22Crub2.1]
MRCVLIIDDNPAVGEALSLALSLREIRPLVALTPEEGLAMLGRERIDVVIQDMNFTADTTSGEEGIALFKAIRARYTDLPVILLTAWTHLEAAVELVKAGASDYLAKPWDDNKLLATVENLLELAEANREATRVHVERRRRREALESRYELDGLVFASEAMSRTIELACQVARSDVSVLVTGPNGAGKERIAAIVHANSAVRHGPFVAVNCGALPGELIEAELFGADAGAYTGANKAREGRFEMAHGGTLFLDEIGNLPLPGQMKLLRVLETGQFERLGSGRTRQVKVRLVSATNADLKAMIAAGTFREDLYYRLNVIDVNLPPLSERSDDILPLAGHFLDGKATLTEDAREALLAHTWPGNVRELKNAIARAALLAPDGRIEPVHLNLPPPSANATRNLDEPSRESVEAALASAGGVISRAANSLGLSRQALYRRMERYGLAV